MHLSEIVAKDYICNVDDLISSVNELANRTAAATPNYTHKEVQMQNTCNTEKSLNSCTEASYTVLLIL